MANSKSLCAKCPLRSKCRVPCERIKSLVNKDQVRRKEVPLSRIRGVPSRCIWEEYSGSSWKIPLTKREREIVTLLGKGLDRGEIVQVLKISRHALRERLSKLKMKCDECLPIL